MLQLVSGFSGVKSVQPFAASVSIPTGWYSAAQDITLSAAVDPTQAFVILNSIHPLHPNRGFGVGAQVLNATTIRLNVQGGAGDPIAIVPIKGCVVEPRQVKSLQSVITGSNTADNYVTINSVNPAKAFLVMAGFANGVNVGLNVQMAASLYSATQVLFQVSNSQGAYLNMIRCQIIEMR